MSKINFGILLLFVAITFSIMVLVKLNNHSNLVKDQLELINAKIDDLDNDVHELEKYTKP